MSGKIKILSMMTPRSQPRQTNTPENVLAWFDFEFAGLALRGCAFVRGRDSTHFSVWTPSSSRLDAGRAVEFADHSLRIRVVRAAQRVFEELGPDGVFIAPAGAGGEVKAPTTVLRTGGGR